MRLSGKTTEALNNQTNLRKKDQDFPFVAIGASAGGLEPLRILLEHTPINTGLALIIIQHLAAGQESMLTEILARYTQMPVTKVENGIKVEPNHVYVIPPGSLMTLANGVLKLNPKGKSLKPIDAFFNSLALEQKNRAIGVVLSGTGNDGTNGLKAIKAEGGITFAQDPESAQYSDMPQNAILAECVDRILTPQKIAEELAKVAKHPEIIRAQIEAKRLEPKQLMGLQVIFTMLKSSFGVDFSNYKEPFIQRRLKRRMVINDIHKIEDYANYLSKHPKELQALFGDMLIGVTSFFRESNTFTLLKEQVFPELLKQRSPQQTLRIWIAGCSTGEEAYTYAIALKEFLEETSQTYIPIQVFGTDLNAKNVDKARQGIYPSTIESNLSEECLKKYFVRIDGNYQIAKHIRELCVFAKQDLTADPPFSNLDLVSCRNMLIYFNSELQEKIIPLLHYALKPSGFLILGQSENISKLSTFFESCTKKGIIYRKKQVIANTNFRFTATVINAPKKALREPVRKDLLTELQADLDRLLTTELSPPALLVNSDLDILIFRGLVAPFLSPESGAVSFNLTKLIRKEIRGEIQSAAFEAKKERQTIKKEAIQFQYGTEQKTINIQVRPISPSKNSEQFFLVLFEDVSAAAAHLRQTIELSTTPQGRENVKDNQVRELREELEASKQSLQTITETQEATNEELRSAMEEVQSSNEELQSTNEELETAKEELQSSNEELQTLNDELRNRNQTLGRLNDDLANLQINIDATVVIVDAEFKIRRFTNSALKLLKILPSDVGRPITNTRLGIKVDDLGEILNDVITKPSTVEREVTGGQNSWFVMKVRPYLTVDKTIGGAVLSLVDITEIRKRDEALQESEKEYRSLFSNMIDAFSFSQMVFDDSGKPIDFVYLQINDAYERMIGLKKERIIGKKASQVIPGIREDNPELFDQYGRVALTGKKEKFEYFLKHLQLWLNVSVYSPKKGYFAAVLENITERKKIEEALKESEQLYHTLFDNGEDGFQLIKIIYDEAGNPTDFEFLKVNRAYEDQTSLKESDVVGKTVKEAIPNIEQSWISTYGNVAKTGKSKHFINYNQRTHRWYDVNAFLYAKDQVGALFRDITKRKEAEIQLKQRKDQLALELERFFSMIEDLPVMVCLITADYQIDFANRLFREKFGEPKGRRCYQYVGGCVDTPCAKCESLIPLKTGKPHHWTVTFPDGTVVDAHDYPFTDVDGRKMVLEADIDITEQLNLQKQLQDKERMAAIGQTAGMVGHDIRNPLQTITGEVYMAKMELENVPEGEAKQNLLEGLRIIDEQTVYVNKIVQDLQDYTKALKPKIEDVKLSETIQAVKSSINIPENITFECSTCMDFPKLKMDQTFIRRILQNLLNNAIQAMPKGGKLSIKVANVKEKVVITFEDTGDGIPIEVRDKLFTPLITTKAKGQGFGLAVVKRLTEAMGGTVSFKSEIGKGTQFILTFAQIEKLN
jgi:PAS domain S-box-containing protein